MTPHTPRHALVTGASGALGGAICRRLAADGCHIICHAHTRSADAARLISELNALGATADLCVFDLADAHAVAAGYRFFSYGDAMLLDREKGADPFSAVSQKGI